jgi:hypothetical protein
MKSVSLLGNYFSLIMALFRKGSPDRWEKSILIAELKRLTARINAKVICDLPI